MKVRVLGSPVVGKAACLWLGCERDGWGLLLDFGLSVSDGSIPSMDFLGSLPVDGLLITHAHLDHIGGVPFLLAVAPEIPIYASHGTRLCMGPMLMDAAKVARSRENGSYEVASDIIAMEVARRTVPLRPFQTVQVGKVKVTAMSAGHIPGSLWFFLETPDGLRVAYTGDINHASMRACQPLDWPVGEVDLLITESTYGCVSFPSRKEVEQHFVGLVKQTLAAGGRVLIPAFALGRAQEILRLLITSGVDGPIYVAGLAATVTLLLEAAPEIDPKLGRIKRTQGTVFMHRNVVYAVGRGTRDLLRSLDSKFPCVVVASSGMLAGGVSQKVLPFFLGEEDAALIFTGYLDPDSPGAKIAENPESVACRVEQVNLSAHADSNGLVQFAARTGAEKVVITHGTPDSSACLARAMEKHGLEAENLLERELSEEGALVV